MIAVLEGDNVVAEHKSLTQAMRLPPPSPEAEIRERGSGFLLAESDPFNARWETTERGKLRAQVEHLTTLVALKDLADEEEAQGAA